MIIGRNEQLKTESEMDESELHAMKKEKAKI